MCGGTVRALIVTIFEQGHHRIYRPPKVVSGGGNRHLQRGLPCRHAHEAASLHRGFRHRRPILAFTILCRADDCQITSACALLGGTLKSIAVVGTGGQPVLAISLRSPSHAGASYRNTGGAWAVPLPYLREASWSGDRTLLICDEARRDSPDSAPAMRRIPCRQCGATYPANDAEPAGVRPQRTEALAHRASKLDRRRAD